MTNTDWTLNNKALIQTGAFRECFSKNVRLGMPDNPINITDECHPEQTQDDPRSSIRSCICTTDLCNLGPSSDKQMRAVTRKNPARGIETLTAKKKTTTTWNLDWELGLGTWTWNLDLLLAKKNIDALSLSTVLPTLSRPDPVFYC
jgi:hypothetical protein